MDRGDTTVNKRALRFVFFLLLAAAILIIYNIFDNQRFIVVEQEIPIARLPESFDGFRILQISDLHGRSFGEHQADLIAAINALDYDMIAFTGDMNESSTPGDTPETTRALLYLLDGIENKERVFWVDGNAGPHAIESFTGAQTGDATPIGLLLREKDVTLLVLPQPITRGANTIWITPEMFEMGFEMRYRSRSPEEAVFGGRESYDRVMAFYEQSYSLFNQINGNGEVKIMLAHEPKQINMSDEDRELWGELDYDLILAGHYHGGQIRMPLIGALYIPSPTTGINNSGFLPDQKAVKGVSYYGSTPQYVSAGLGASGHVRPLAFRLFNTPEINLITLTQPAPPQP